MGAVQKSLRLPEETVKEIDKLAKERGEDFSATAKNLLEEAIKMRRCPGIIFASGVSGLRARLAGTGIEELVTLLIEFQVKMLNQEGHLGVEFPGLYHAFRGQ